MFKKTKYFLAATALLGMALSGCSQEGDQGSTSTTTPIPFSGELNPTGTLQGNLVDTVTLKPIVGAVIDIGVGKATTSSTGEFVIYNVPANKDVLTEKVTGTYMMTIDLRNVTSPVNMMNAATSPRYPDFSLNDELIVTYSSFNENVPVTQLVSNLKLVVGKLAATISGVVGYESTKQPVGSGWTVKLVSIGSKNDGTGDPENVVGSTTTDANGAFTFANVESLRTFRIDAWNSAGTFKGSEDVTAPADGETKTLVIQHNEGTYDNSAVFVSSVDAQDPSVISVSPEKDTDLSPTGGVNVVLTFSEPIRQDAYATTLSNNNVFGGGATGLWADVQVNYDGPKAGNIAHTLSWSTDRKSLTVNIPTLAPASRYTVDLSDAVGKLMDDSNRPLITSNYISTTFTTNGAATAAAPTVTLVNAASIDSVGAPVLDWLPVSGAKAYNVYRAKNQVWGTTVNSGAYELIDTVTVSGFTDGALNFVENSQTKLTGSYVVKSVNADGTESTASTVVTAEDKVGPVITAPAPTLTGSPATLTLTFGEYLDEVTAETTANYTWLDSAARDTQTTPTVISITGAVYNPVAKTVTLTLSGTLNSATVTQSSITTGANGISNTTAAAGDTQVIPVGQGAPTQTCITAGGNAVLDTVVMVGDDTITGAGAAAVVTSGVNGICQTTANVNDIQLITVGNGAPNQTAVSAGADLAMTTGAAGDDQPVPVNVLQASGVKDVAGNTIRTIGDVVTTDGTIQ